MGLGLVIGGNGYIGSYLKTRLNVDVVDAGWYGSDLGLPWFDFADYDYVVLLAAHASTWLCETEPNGSWVNNVDEFRHLLDMLPVGLPLIYASSGSVYGLTGRNAMEIDTPSTPVAHYDLQKLTIDLIAQHAIRAGHRLVGLRFGTVNGIAPHTRVDLMVNAMVNTALTEGKITVGNRDKRRALLWLPDLAEAIYNIIKRPSPGVYNLASTNITVGDIADAVAAHLDVPTTDAQFTNPFSFGLDCSKFIKTFGDYRITHQHEVIDDLAAGLRTVRTTRRDELP